MKMTRLGSSYALSFGASTLAAVVALAGCNIGGSAPDHEPDDPSDLAGSGSVDGPEQDGAAASDKAPQLADGEERVGGELVAKLDIGRSRLYFIGSGAKGSAEEAVFVVSAVAPRAMSPSAFPELADASPLELFNAATLPGTPVPEKISRLYGNDPKLGPQGWMLAAMDAAPRMLTSGHCNNASFMSTVESYDYDDRSTPLYRLDQVPGVDSDGVWAYDDECFGTSWPGGCPWFYGYQAQFSDVDGFYARVAVCDLDAHPTLVGTYSTWAHPGPTIEFWHRAPGETSFELTFNVDVAADQVGWVWAWHGTALDHDRKTIVQLAEAADAFDIATAVEDL